MSDDFEIVFTKLEELVATGEATGSDPEANDLEEMRQFIAELAEPDDPGYLTTV